MLATNIEKEVFKILKKKGKGGWLRVQQCANEYAKDKTTGEINASKKTKFYHWRKKVEKRKVPGFQYLPLGKSTYIGLDNADPRAISEVKTDKQYEKRLGAIRQELLSDPMIAYFDLIFFIDTLPRIKDKLESELLIATVAIMKANEWRSFEDEAQKQKRLRIFISIIVLYFINKIPMLLNEEFGTVKEKEEQPVSVETKGTPGKNSLSDLATSIKDALNDSEELKKIQESLSKLPRR
jgi:hypothetical protein